ncbi:MAG: cation diffusion facilitator family transporter [Acidobacteriota bacterium]
MNKKISTDNDAKKITIIGIALNIILIIFKFIAGIFGTSKAMIADAFHSTSDLIADVIVLFGLKVSSKPRDEAHHYGHGKVDSLVSLFIGIILIVLLAGLIVNSYT